MSVTLSTAEKRLVEICSDLLDVDVAPEDNFFDVGGYSLLVVKLVAEARKAGIELTAGLVFEHQTIEAIAAVAVAGAPPAKAAAETFDELWYGATGTWEEPGARALIPLTEGTGTPFFCVHWGSGNVEFMKRFAERAGFGRPSYGLRSPAIVARERPLLSIADMAERYLTEIRALQPHGPYLLGGLCSGGLVAYEMAQRLTAAGEAVAHVALINCEPPSAPHGFDFGWGLADFYRFRLAWLGKRTGSEDLAADAARVMRELKAVDWYDADADPAEFHWLHLVWAALVFAQVHYEARPYGGPVTVFQPEECANDPRYSWRSLVPDLTEQSHADSDTWEMLRDDRLWRTLEARLAAADAA